MVRGRLANRNDWTLRSVLWFEMGYANRQFRELLVKGPLDRIQRLLSFFERLELDLSLQRRGIRFKRSETTIYHRNGVGDLLLPLLQSPHILDELQVIGNFLGRLGDLLTTPGRHDRSPA